MSVVFKKSMVKLTTWIEETKDKINEIQGDQKMFLKCCLGKKVRLDGQIYHHGGELVKALRKYIKRESGGIYRYTDWIDELAKAIDVPERMIRKVIRYGPNFIESNKHIIEISRPCNVIHEKVTTKKNQRKVVKDKERLVEQKKMEFEQLNGEIRSPCDKKIDEMIEYWDINKTQKLLRVTCNSKAWIIIDVIQNSKISECKNYYLNRVYYRYGKKRAEGRLYADVGSFQGLSGPMRRYMTDSNHPRADEFSYCDIDMANAFPSILYQIALRYGCELKYMKHYIDNRAEVLKETMESYNISRDVAKKLFLAVMHGGSYLNQLKRDGIDLDSIKHISGTFIIDFKSDIRKCYDEMKDHPDFIDITQEIENDPSKQQVRGTWISYVCQRYESRILDIVVDKSREWGYDPQTKVFDGFLVRRMNDENYHNSIDEYLRELSEVTLESTGFDMIFTSKPLEMEPGDHEKIFGDTRPHDYFEDLTKLYDESNMLKENTPTGLRHVMHPITDEKRITIVTGSMGVGKSHSVHQYLSKKLQEDQSTTVISISCRRTHARQQQGQYDSLGFTHYQESISDRLVIQYESLRKLYLKLTNNEIRYNIVILDEIMSILKLIVSTTNRKYIKQSHEVLRLILQMADKVIALDADCLYDMSVHEYFTNEFQSEEIEHLWYQPNPTKRNLIYTSEPNLYSMISEDMEQGNNIVVCFRSQRKMKQWLNTEVTGEYYRNEAGERCVVRLGDKYKVHAFSSDSTEEQLEIFKDVNNRLPKERLVLAYTSKIMAGIDLLIPFVRVYVDGAGRGGVSARGMHQMVGRARIVTSNQVFVLAPKPDKTQMRDPETYAEMYTNRFKSIEHLRDRRDEYISSILDQYKLQYVMGKIKWTPDPILRIFCHAEIEQNAPWFADFHRQAIWKGYDIQCKFNNENIEEIASIEYDNKASSKELKVREYKELHDAYEKIKDYSIDKILSICDDLKKNPESGKIEDRIINNMAFACKLVPKTYAEIGLDAIEYIMKHTGKVYLFKAMSLIETDAEFLLKDLNSLHYAPIPEIYHLKGAYIKRLDRLLKEIGFEYGIKDTKTIIEADKLQAILEKYKGELAKLQKERAFRGRSKHGLNTLKAELSVLGLTLKRERIHVSGKQYIYRYKIQPEPILERITEEIDLRYKGEIDENEKRYRDSVLPDFKNKEINGQIAKWEYRDVIDKYTESLPNINDVDTIGDIEIIKDIDVDKVTDSIGLLPYTLIDGKPHVLLSKVDNKLIDIGRDKDGLKARECIDQLISEKFNARFKGMRPLNKNDRVMINERLKHGIYLRYIKFDQNLVKLDSNLAWINLKELNYEKLYWRLRGIIKPIIKMIDRFS